jgi:hypothetical protein
MFWQQPATFPKVDIRAQFNQVKLFSIAVHLGVRILFFGTETSIRQQQQQLASL